MTHREVVVVGASAGGIEALQQVLQSLPKHFDAAVLIVLHTSSRADSLLPQILQRSSLSKVVHPHDGEILRKGNVYIAVPDYHMIVEGNMIRVIQGPRENLHRPAIDPLFRSAASSWGRKTIGVVLTGSLDDGTSGLMLVRGAGGAAIVQDPKTAMFSSMPASALEQVPDALVLPVSKIGAALERLVTEPLEGGRDDRMRPASLEGLSQAEQEVRIAKFDTEEIEDEHHAGEPSGFACPDCGGVLWELEDKTFLRFRCRVGHAFTARHLGAEQRHAVETALWSALRALEESASLYRRMADRASHKGQNAGASKYDDRVTNTLQNARTLRDFLIQVNKEEDRFSSPQMREADDPIRT